MKLIYIAGPFRAVTVWAMEQNIRVAESLALAAWKTGFAVICPHANTRFFQGEMPDQTWLDGDKEMVKRCDAVLLVEGWDRSEGARDEMRLAQEMEIPVFDDLSDLIRWRDGA